MLVQCSANQRDREMMMTAAVGSHDGEDVRSTTISFTEGQRSDLCVSFIVLNLRKLTFAPWD
jgi:hypothetical protein